MPHKSDSDRIIDWGKAIGTLILIHQHIRDLDHDKLWGHELPRVAAREDDLVRAESVLGMRLDRHYREFLAHADGWSGFYQWVDLFGTTDLQGQPMRRARERLDALERNGALAPLGMPAKDVLPIAMTRESVGTQDVDLFVIVKQACERAGEVIWLSFEEVDRFQNFDSFFLAMMDYNREEVNHLLKKARQRGRLM